MTPRIGCPVAASTGNPQVIRSRVERDQGAMPASNAAAIRSDASSVVMLGSLVVVDFTADEGASGIWLNLTDHTRRSSLSSRLGLRPSPPGRHDRLAPTEGRESLRDVRLHGMDDREHDQTDSPGTLGFLALIGLASPDTVTAAPLSGVLTYHTTGNVGNYTGAPVGSISFDGTWSIPLLTPGSISLGQFVSRPLPEGAGLTYHDMPFYITLVAEQGDGGYDTTSGLSIAGLLNGTVTGTTQSDVMATITSVQPYGMAPLPFPLSNFHVDAPQLLAAPGVNGGRTTLNVRIDPFPPPIPEPTSWAVFALALVAGLHRLRRARRGHVRE